MGQALSPLWYPYLPGVRCGASRSELLRVGDSHTQYYGLESALLFHDRWSLRDLQGTPGKRGLEQLRCGRWRRQGPAMRELHGTVRLRALCNDRSGRQTRRYLEKHLVQLWPPPPAKESSGSQDRIQWNLGRRNQAKAGINRRAWLISIGEHVNDDQGV